jgi:hypothetical protein
LLRQLAHVFAGTAAILSLGACAETPPTAPAAPTPPSGITQVPRGHTFQLDLGGSAGLGIPFTVLDFGEVQVGAASAAQVVNVTNQDISPLVLSGAGGNPGGEFTGAQSCQGVTLVGGASCQLSYAFIPTAEGPASAVSSGTWNGQAFSITLRGTGVGPRLHITPGGFDFGPVATGTASKPDTAVVTNVGRGPVTMSGAGGNPGGQFTGAQSCQGLTLPVGGHCYLIYNFLPTAAGPDSSVSAGTWNGVPFNVRLRGVGVGPVFRITPYRLDFGEVEVGAASKPDTASITNIGLTPVTMSGAGGNPGGQFTGAQSCQGLTLPVGGTCYLIYNFVPSATGPASAFSAGTWNGVPFHVDLVGTGIAAGSSPTALFRIWQTALDFGDVQVGTVSKADTVVVTNITTAPVVMSGAGGNPGGEFTGAQSCQGLTLAPGASCYLIYNFVPTAAGLDSAVSSGTWNGQPFNIKLRGNGVPPSLHIDPSGLDFGNVQIATASKADTAVVTNVGPAPVTMSGAGGNPGGQFTGAQSCQGRTLAAGDRCYLIYNFVPTTTGLDSAVSAGTWNGVPFSVKLKGNGVAPLLVITPAGFDFGRVTVGSGSAQLTAIVTNEGVGPIQMSGAGGNPGAPFTGAQSCQGLTLAVGGTCELIYGFQPTAVGPASATSAGTWNGQPFSIPLEGVGFEPVLQETMDVRPAAVILRNSTPVRAALLSTPTFDATAVSLPSVLMLVNGTTDVPPARRNGAPIAVSSDVNTDGLLDLVITFNLSDLAAAGLAPGATSGALLLHGTINGELWRASDPVLPVIEP